MVTGLEVPARAMATTALPALGVIAHHVEPGGQVAAEGRVEVRRRHPPWLLDGHGSPRHPHRGEVPGPAERREVGDQDLAPPQRAIAAVAETVEGDSDHRSGLAVVGEAGGDMGVVMLDRHPLHAIQLEGVLGGEVLRVQVVGDQLGTHLEEAHEVLDPLEVGAEGLVVLQVADVVGDEGPAPLGQAERALQLSTAAEHRPAEGMVDRHRLGDEPARASQRGLLPPLTRITELSVRM